MDTFIGSKPEFHLNDLITFVTIGKNDEVEFEKNYIYFFIIWEYCN
jgi:hypothetical protein